MEFDVVEDSLSEAFDLLFWDCDKRTPPPIPSSMPAKFASLMEACGFEFCEIPPFSRERRHAMV